MSTLAVNHGAMSPPLVPAPSETARIAVQSALTGHRVFSSVHAIRRS